MFEFLKKEEVFFCSTYIFYQFIVYSFLQYMYLCIIQYLPAPALINYAYIAPGERLGSDLTVSWTCSVAYQTMLWLFIVRQWRRDLSF